MNLDVEEDIDKIYAITKKIKVYDCFGLIGSFDCYSAFEKSGENLREKPLGNTPKQLIEYLKRFSGIIDRTLPPGIDTEIIGKNEKEKLFPLDDDTCRMLEQKGIRIQH